MVWRMRSVDKASIKNALHTALKSLSQNSSIPVLVEHCIPLEQWLHEDSNQGRAGFHVAWWN